MTTALVMAGGKGTRMDIDEEKPLIKVNNKPMIECVLTAVETYFSIFNEFRKYLEKDEEVMTIVSDLPFVTSKHIDDVLETYYKRNKPAMCVSVPKELFDEYDIIPTLVYEGLVPSGVNMLIANDKEQDQTIYVTDNVELAFNINTIHDLDKSNDMI